jgi:hypothetical protein
LKDRTTCWWTCPVESASFNGLWEYAAVRSGDWTPVQKSLKGVELSLSVEKQAGGLLNTQNVKVTAGDVGAVLKPEKPPATGFRNAAGFISGIGGSIAGAELTDNLIGHRIGNADLRKAVNGFGGGMAGVVTDAVVTKFSPAVAAKLPVLSRVGAAITASAPVAQAAAKFLGAVGRVLPNWRVVAAGAVASGRHDAYKNFQVTTRRKAGNRWARAPCGWAARPPSR